MLLVVAKYQFSWRSQHARQPPSNLHTFARVDFDELLQWPFEVTLQDLAIAAGMDKVATGRLMQFHRRIVRSGSVRKVNCFEVAQKVSLR